MDALQCVDVSKNYGGTVALSKVSLSLGLHQILGVMGPNGAGKSTLVDIISGFTKPNSGKILLSGKDITGQPPYKIAEAGVMRSFQLVRNFTNMSILENVVSATKTAVNEQAVKEAENILSEFGLAGLMSEKVKSLAYGEQKILELARVRMRAPTVVLLDEPSSGVDPKYQERIVSYIMKLKHEASIALIEHNMSMIQAVCDQVIALDHGTMVCSGTPAEVLADAQVVASYFGK